MSRIDTRFSEKQFRDNVCVIKSLFITDEFTLQEKNTHHQDSAFVAMHLNMNFLFLTAMTLKRHATMHCITIRLTLRRYYFDVEIESNLGFYVVLV